MPKSETVAKLKREIASQKRLIGALKEALGELIGHCPGCGAYISIVGWNSEIMMRKCSNPSCKRSLTPLPGLAIKKVEKIEEELLGRRISGGNKISKGLSTMSYLWAS
jgi:hypothetical protein